MFRPEPYRSQRTVLLNILAELPLRTVNDQHALIIAVTWIIEFRSQRDHWVALDIDDRFLGRYWSPSVCHPTEAGIYSRHTLECAVLFEIMAGNRSGDLYVEGAAHFGNYHAELFDGHVDEQAVTMAFHKCGLSETTLVLVDVLKSFNAGLPTD